MFGHQIDERAHFCGRQATFAMHDMDRTRSGLVLLEHDGELAGFDQPRDLVREKPRNAHAAHSGLERRIVVIISWATGITRAAADSAAFSPRSISHATVRSMQVV